MTATSGRPSRGAGAASQSALGPPRSRRAPRPAKMALARAGCGLRRLGPGPGPALAAGLGPARGITRAGSRSLLAAVASKVKQLNGRYERFLERTCPRFYLLHATFTRGLRALFLEAREVGRIRARMAQQRLSSQQLPYREQERLRQFRRDVLKAAPALLIALPPFANFLLLLLMYLFPRQILIRHFWTPAQQLQFLDANHARRRRGYPLVLSGLALAAPSPPQPRLQGLLRQLCAQVQAGCQPQVAQLCALRPLFSGPPLGLNQLRVSHVRALSRILFLTPYLPGALLRRRLRSHLLEILQLDRALLRLGLAQLCEQELRAACYLRGLNSTHLGLAECRAWMEQWLRLSCSLQASEASLLAHSMVLLALNYSQAQE